MCSETFEGMNDACWRAVRAAGGTAAMPGPCHELCLSFSALAAAVCCVTASSWTPQKCCNLHPHCESALHLPCLLARILQRRA